MKKNTLTHRARYNFKFLIVAEYLLVGACTISYLNAPRSEAALREYQLRQALLDGDDAAALKAIHAGAEVNATDSVRTEPWRICTMPAVSLCEDYGYTRCKYFTLLWGNRDGNSDAMLDVKRLGLLKDLLRCGADPNATDKMGSALVCAARCNFSRSAELLIKYGARVNQVDSDGVTALESAVNSGNLDCMNLLLSRGADANSYNALGKTPLMLASGQQGQNALMIIESLINHGADVNRLSRSGQTALDIANLNENTEGAKLLKRYHGVTYAELSAAKRKAESFPLNRPEH